MKIITNEMSVVDARCGCVIIFDKNGNVCDGKLCLTCYNNYEEYENREARKMEDIDIIKELINKTRIILTTKIKP